LGGGIMSEPTLSTCSLRLTWINYPRTRP
jgi:hypothetical protein